MKGVALGAMLVMVDVRLLYSEIGTDVVRTVCKVMVSVKGHDTKIKGELHKPAAMAEIYTSFDSLHSRTSWLKKLNFEVVMTAKGLDKAETVYVLARQPLIVAAMADASFLFDY
ncbi:hypothetical protein Tco_0077995 [Tanacetum coccineum]